ncbi:transcriptional activator domain [Candidatus Moduliflexus flocculans]|uniref:Transcriptional activator domain n=1 Tax=Candidatus Moduliflexus flocculans TaxID=1499966 RepID=A0A0S6W495_9BACT|nr:transcriptional activator domain [Candidatus Moduliflexus flocculans]
MHDTSSLKLCWFGSPQVELNGERVELDTRKSIALLAYLTMNKQAHSREKLVSLFWPESPSAQAFTSLRKTLWTLKQRLTDTWFDIRRQSVELSSNTGLWVDIHSFDRAVNAGAGHDHAPSTACAECLPSLLHAIDLYRDDFLRGFTLPDSPSFDDWQFFHTDMLRDRFIDALKRVLHYYAARKEFSAAIRCAQRWLAASPAEEAAHRELMRLYTLNHQRAAALQQYQECVRLLKQEFDAEPEQQTQDLYDALLSQDGATTFQVQQIAAAAPLRESPSFHIRGMFQQTAFIGRTRELKEIRAILQRPDCRLLTLLGMGGIGKTRIAEQLVSTMIADYPDGVYFVPLAPLSSPEQIAPAIVETLHCLASAEEEALNALTQFLSTKKLLLILDNAEHLLAGVGVLRECLQAAPAIQFVVTSRERLNLRGEWVYNLHGLAYPEAVALADVALEEVEQRYDAVRLLMRSAQRQHPDFTLSEANLPHILRLCRLADGMPLALELAASWCHILSCDQIVAEIEQSLDVLTSRSPDYPARHQSVRAVFDSLWMRLSMQEQRRLCQLSIFQGSFDVAEAETIAGTSLPLLASFVDRALVQSYANGRFALHPLLQRFLADKREQDAPEEAALIERFCAWFERFVIAQSDCLKTERQQSALSAMSAASPNIRQAWELAAAQQNLPRLQAMLPRLALFYEIANRLQEGRDVFQHALTLCRQQQPDHLLCAQLIVHIAACSRYNVYNAETLPDYQQALQRLRTSGAATSAYTYFWIGCLKTWYRQQNEDTGEWVELLDDLAAQSGDCWDMALAAFLRGEWLYQTRQSLELAHICFQQALTLRQQLGDLWGQTTALNSLGHVALNHGRYREAQHFHEEALRMSQELRDEHGIAWAKSQLGEIAILLGDYQRAWTYERESLAIVMQLGCQGLAAWRFSACGFLLMIQGEYDSAETYFQQSLAIFQRLRHPEGWPAQLLNLAELRWRTGRIGEAAAFLEKSRLLASPALDHYFETWFCYTQSRISAASGATEQAWAQLFTAIDMAAQRPYLMGLLEFLTDAGERLLKTAETPFGLQTLAFAAQHDATPFYAKQQAKTALARQQKTVSLSVLQSAVAAGQTASLGEIIEHLRRMAL